MTGEMTCSHHVWVMGRPGCVNCGTPAPDPDVTPLPDDAGVRIIALVYRAYAWYEQHHPEELAASPTSAEVALAVTKPYEERGELVGAFTKWRRAVTREQPELVQRELWREVESELADAFISPLMTARALGLSLDDILDIFMDRIEALELRPSSERHA